MYYVMVMYDSYSGWSIDFQSPDFKMAYDKYVECTVHEKMFLKKVFVETIEKE